MKRYFLPLLSVWVLAVVVLAGLIYWGGSPEEAANSTPQRSASQSRVKPEKPAEAHRPVPENNPLRTQAPSPPLPGEAKASSPANPPTPSQGNAAREEASVPQKPPSQMEQDRLASVRAHSEAPGPATGPVQRLPEPPLTPYVARAAIVIDDFGLDLEVARKFLKIPLPLTFSILPHQKHSQEIASLAHSHRREVLLHLPMQPQGYPLKNPGKGALLTSMSHDLLKKTLLCALDVSPYFTGVNNHMGSRFTEDRNGMQVFLKELKQKGLYFLDSSTSPRSIGVSLAEELRVPTARRDVFLDHTATEDSVRSQIALLIRKARTEGSAIAIGHPYDVTLKVLSQEAEQFREEGVAVISAGELISGRASTSHLH